MAAAIKSALSALHLTSSEASTERNPQAPNPGEVLALKSEYQKYGQEHVFAFWDELNDEQKAALFDQLSGFKPARISVCSELTFLQFFSPLSFRGLVIVGGECY